MSIVIRLQNLPLYATAGDVRRFFSGLRIPNGGVHIIGGKKGDAFIVFSSDEDARLAMRKDGCKIMDARVKLYLSSHAELQHEIEKITGEVPNISRKGSPVRRHRDSRSPLNKRGSDWGYQSNSLKRGKRGNSHRSPSPRIKCRSPKRFSRTPRRSMSPKRLSRSPRRSMTPRKFSRSPRRSASPKIFYKSKRLSRSPRRLSRSPRRLSRSPKRGSILHRERSSSPKKRSPSPTRSHSSVKRRWSPHRRQISPYGRDVGGFGDKKDNNLLKVEEIFGVEQYFKSNSMWESKELSKQEKQTLFEQKIAEALTHGLSSLQKQRDAPQLLSHSVVDKQIESGGMQFTRPPDTHLATYEAEYNNSGPREFPNQGGNNFPMPDTLPTPIMQQPSSFFSHVQSFQLPVPPFLPTSNVLPMESLPPQMATHTSGLPTPSRYTSPLPLNTNPPADSLSNPFLHPNIPNQFFFVSLSVLPQNWEERTVSNMLRGIFLPLKNIKFDLDNEGNKTGTVHIKLCNKQDFKCLLSHPTYCYRTVLVSVNECPDYVVNKYFPPEMPSEASLISQRGNYCYKMNRLPRRVVCEEILDFFAGLEITDLYIVNKFKEYKGYNYKDCLGFAFVAFGNISDYKMAFSKNEQPFGKKNRIIRLYKIPRRKMLQLKEDNGDLLSQSTEFVPSDIAPVRAPLPGSSQVRPLCTLLTGLPQYVTVKQICAYFKAARAQPGKIHILLDDNREPNGRAFVEFNSLTDFDNACKCSGNQFGNSIICVKQILYDEMLKGLESQRGMHTFCRDNSYSHQPFNRYANAPNQMSAQRFPFENNFRMTHNDADFIPGRSNVQVFDYGNEFMEPLPMPDTTSEPLDKFPFNRHVPQSPPEFENRNSFYGKVDNTRQQEPGCTPVSSGVKTKTAISMNSKVEAAMDSFFKAEQKYLKEKKDIFKISPECSAASSKLLPESKNNGNKSNSGLSKSKTKLSKKDFGNEVETIVLESSSSETEDLIYNSSKNKSKGRNGRWVTDERQVPPLGSSTHLRRTTRSPLRSENYFESDSYAYKRMPTYD